MKFRAKKISPLGANGNAFYLPIKPWEKIRPKKVKPHVVDPREIDQHLNNDWHTSINFGDGKDARRVNFIFDSETGYLTRREFAYNEKGELTIIGDDLLPREKALETIKLFESKVYGSYAEARKYHYTRSKLVRIFDRISKLNDWEWKVKPAVAVTAILGGCLLALTMGYNVFHSPKGDIGKGIFGLEYMSYKWAWGTFILSGIIGFSSLLLNFCDAVIRTFPYDTVENEQHQSQLKKKLGRWIKTPVTAEQKAEQKRLEAEKKRIVFIKFLITADSKRNWEFGTNPNHDMNAVREKYKELFHNADNPPKVEDLLLNAFNEIFNLRLPHTYEYQPRTLFCLFFQSKGPIQPTLKKPKNADEKWWEFFTNLFNKKPSGIAEVRDHYEKLYQGVSDPPKFDDLFLEYLNYLNDIRYSIIENSPRHYRGGSNTTQHDSANYFETSPSVAV